MKIDHIKKKHGLKDKDIAEMFGYANANSYANSKKAKPKLEKGIEAFYAHLGRIPENVLHQNPKYILKQMNRLTSAQRMDIMSEFCKACGSDDLNCQCWNDE